MAEIIDVAGYLCENYPYKGELSKARLTKMVYLADWKSCVDRNKQITRICWIFNHYGPYVDDVVADVKKHQKNFEINVSSTMYGDTKEVISLTQKKEWALSEEEKRIIDHIIEQTKTLTWNSFIRLVYSTFPVLVSERSSSLDLQKLARRYQREMKASAAV